MKYEPISGREFPRFSGIKTFFRLPHVVVNSDYDLALFGIPYDGGVSYRPGARFAPSQIREASSLGRGFHWQRSIQIFEQLKIADIGDCPTVPIDQTKTYERIEKFVSALLELNKKFIGIGGDHSVTLPVLRSLKKKYKHPVRLIHFDAHLDTYPAAWDCEYHHGSFLRHAINEGLVKPSKSIQIGIRGPLVGPADQEFGKKHGIQVTTVDDIRVKGLESFIQSLPDFRNDSAGLPAYISFDIDCLDPAYAPGTGTPVVGGLTTYEVQRILRALRITHLVGADIVEVCPTYDHAEITSLAAMDIVFEMMSLFAMDHV